MCTHVGTAIGQPMQPPEIAPVSFKNSTYLTCVQAPLNPAPVPEPVSHEDPPFIAPLEMPMEMIPAEAPDSYKDSPFIEPIQGPLEAELVAAPMSHEDAPLISPLEVPLELEPIAMPVGYDESPFVTPYQAPMETEPIAVPAIYEESPYITLSQAPLEEAEPVTVPLSYEDTPSITHSPVPQGAEPAFTPMSYEDSPVIAPSSMPVEPEYIDMPSPDVIQLEPVFEPSSIPEDHNPPDSQLSEWPTEAPEQEITPWIQIEPNEMEEPLVSEWLQAEPTGEEELTLSSTILTEPPIGEEEEPMLTPWIQAELSEREESTIAPLREDLDAELQSHCSSVAIKCEAIESTMYEEVEVGSSFSGLGLYSGAPGFGIKHVDTSRPTKPGEPYEIIYLYRQHSCGAIKEHFRFVSVVCPEDKYYCNTAGSPFCSSTELCVDSENIEASLDNGEIREETFEGPSIELNGPSIIEISVGESYRPCNECINQVADGSASVQCDPGAIAIDSIEGNLTEKIEACSKDFNTNYFSNVGLDGCNITTDVPGIHNITFTIKDSLGVVASALRQIVVLPICSEGEIVCREALACSSGGSCFIHTRDTSEQGKVDLDSFESEEVMDRNNTLKLILTENIGELVNITTGETYEKCETGTKPTENVKCEPGVEVMISPSQPSDYEIYVCPSATCRHAGVAFCEAHSFRTTGLESCNIDSNAPAGTQYELTFMAVPSKSTLSPLFVSRYLVIQSLCNEGEYYCEESCSPVPCNQLFTLTKEASPVLTLNYPNGLTLAYGIETGCSILPCQTLESESCGAYAQDEEDGDLSSSIKVVETTPCKSSSCQYCSPQYLASGDCLPGYYSYIYSVVDTAGNEVMSDNMEVNIIELAEIEWSVEK
eukprot:g9198.t1